jgi:hypothetical protein
MTYSSATGLKRFHSCERISRARAVTGGTGGTAGVFLISGVTRGWYRWDYHERLPIRLGTA